MEKAKLTIGEIKTNNCDTCRRQTNKVSCMRQNKGCYKRSKIRNVLSYYKKKQLLTRKQGSLLNQTVKIPDRIIIKPEII